MHPNEIKFVQKGLATNLPVLNSRLYESYLTVAHSLGPDSAAAVAALGDQIARQKQIIKISS